MRFHFHRWSKWERTQWRKPVATIVGVTVDTQDVQKRVCQTCGRTKIRSLW